MGKKSKADAPQKSKVDNVLDEVDRTKGVLQENIELAVARGDKLDQIDSKAENLSKRADEFQKKGRDLRRQKCLQNWKMNCVFFTIFAIIVLILVLIIQGAT